MSVDLTKRRNQALLDALARKRLTRLALAKEAAVSRSTLRKMIANEPVDELPARRVAIALESSIQELAITTL